MGKKTKRIFKAFFVWQDQNEEEWLREMANKGWMFKEYKLYYTFEKSEPKDVIYKLDFKSTKNNDLDEYKALFRDAGWEHRGQFLNWHYFQTDAIDAVTPDIYSDVESKVQKYRSLSYQLLIVLLCIIVLFSTVILNNSSHLEFLKGVYTGLIAILVIAYFKVRFKIHKLKRVE